MFKVLIWGPRNSVWPEGPSPSIAAHILQHSSLQLDRKALKCVRHNKNIELAYTFSACNTAEQEFLMAEAPEWSDEIFGAQ